jgi:hypothetical protein
MVSSEEADNPDLPDLPEGAKGGMVVRGVLNVASGAIPFAGGLLAAAATAWSEREQERINRFLHHWLKMLKEEMREKEQTILEIMSRVDMHDQKTAERVESPEYQQLLRKAFAIGPGQRAKISASLLGTF